MPVYFAVGNHDMKGRKLYESRYGKTFYSFHHNCDLVIVLDPKLDDWNISGKQLKFLQDVLKNEASGVNNIFVFFYKTNNFFILPTNNCRRHKVIKIHNENFFRTISYRSRVIQN